jgi:hypothetical protein
MPGWGGATVCVSSAEARHDWPRRFKQKEPRSLGPRLSLQERHNGAAYPTLREQHNQNAQPNSWPIFVDSV